MLDDVLTTLEIPFTQELQWRQMLLAFTFFLVVAILSLDILRMLME